MGGATSRVRAPRRIGIERLRRIVLTAREDGISLNAAVNMALWGQEPPEMWKDWPPEARQTWDRAVELYEELRSHDHEVQLTPGGVWKVVRRLVPAKTWPRAPGVTFLKLCRHLGQPPSVASYQLELQGWLWKGCFSSRRVEMAPCLGCLIARPAARIDLRTGLGSCCSRRTRS